MKKYIWEVLMTILIISFVLTVFTQYKTAERQNISWNNDYQEYARAVTYLERGKNIEAQEIFERLLSYPEYSNSMILYWMDANALRDMNKLDEAEKRYLEARKIFPAVVKLDDFLKDYAYQKLKQGDFTTCKKYLETLVAITEDAKLKEWAQKNLDALNKIDDNPSES